METGGVGIIVGMVAFGTTGDNLSTTSLIQWIMKRCAELRDEMGADCHVNVVYHVAGSFRRSLGWTGIRRGRFSRDRRAVMMQVAVPERFPTHSAMEAYIFDSLLLAASEARHVFRAKHLGFHDGPADEIFVARLRREFAGTSPPGS